MSQLNNQQKVIAAASKHLGKVGGEGYSDQYNPDLLVKIPRYLNREGYGLTGEEFVGVDVWNAYEVSAITAKGQPVAGMLKIVCPSNSQYHVESKSIKLYLNSLNMTIIGHTAAECIEGIERMVKRDLDTLLEVEHSVTFFTEGNEGTATSFTDEFQPISTVVDLDSINFTAFKSDASQLETGKGTKLQVQSNLLRSNCRVTNQPDWGDVYIHIQGKEVPSAESLAKYIVSHRTVSHFHEEICEMVFAHLKERFKPESLMVSCLYTRRGGLDINPIRATHSHLIPEFFTDPSYRIEKTLRQ